MKRQVALIAATLSLGAMLWLPTPPLVGYGFSFVFLWVLPGLAWGSLMPREALNRTERLIAGLGLSFVTTPTLTLLLAYLPGPLTRPTLLMAMTGATVLPATISLTVRRSKLCTKGNLGEKTAQSSDEPTSFLSIKHWFWREGWAWLLIAVLIAASLRVTNLGYAEFQGDEAVALTRAARILEGDEAAIFQHKKGPAELMVTVSGWRLTGVTNEWMARLPFAWASILGIIAVFLCGRRLKRPHAGGIAACLLAIEGYLVGFGRIVQYQSLVFALSALGLLCLLAYYGSGRGNLVILAAALFAGGALAHYDAILALPAGLFLIGARLWRDRRQGLHVLTPVVIAGLAGVALLSAFYVPFLRSSNVGETTSYLSGRLGGSERFYNHLPSTLERSAVYDAVYLLAAMLLGLAAQIMIAWQRWGRIGWMSSVLLLAAGIAVGIKPDLWVIHEALNLAWIPIALLQLGSMLAPEQSTDLRAIWLWLIVPMLFYLFFVAMPLTHIYTAFPAWAMLAALGLTGFGRWLADRSRTMVYVAGACSVVTYAVCGYYAVMMFVDHTPEYRRTFPEHRHPLYWLPYDEMPQEGLFGFPYRAGWKVVGHLMDAGELSGTYDSNEESEITDFYTRRAVRLNCASPEMYIIAEDVQDEVPVRWDQIETEYHPVAVVTVGGRPKLTVYRRGANGDPITYRAEAYDDSFDRGTTPRRVAAPADDLIQSTPSEGYVSREALIGDFARLSGYKIDTRHAIPGGYVELTLLWEALKPAPADYQVFTHLYDGETMHGQLDGPPMCGNHPTSQWQAGQFIIDPYRIPIKPDASPGPVPLTIGMYDLATMQRQPVTLPNESSPGDHVRLTDLVIRNP